MSVRCAAYIAASIDGFIARPDGDIAWLERPEYSAPSSDDEGGLSYEQFIASVDVLVMGRRTFETVLTFGGWPYEGTPVVVLSSEALTVPRELIGKVDGESGDPAAVLSRIEERGFHSAYIDGGETIRRFLHAGLLDEITITWIPILLGDGIPLFGRIGREIPLELIESHTFKSGLLQCRYRPTNRATPG